MRESSIPNAAHRLPRARFIRVKYDYRVVPAYEAVYKAKSLIKKGKSILSYDREESCVNHQSPT